MKFLLPGTSPLRNAERRSQRSPSHEPPRRAQPGDRPFSFVVFDSAKLRAVGPPVLGQFGQVFRPFVGAPFPHIAGRVVQSEIVRRIGADRRRAAALERAGAVGARGVPLVVPPIARRRTGAVGIFKFRLARQPVRLDPEAPVERRRVGVRVTPVYVDDRAAFPAPAPFASAGRAPSRRRTGRIPRT